MREGEEGGGAGGDGNPGAGPKRDSGTQSDSLKVLHSRVKKLLKEYPDCKLLLLYRSAYGTKRDKKWLLDILHNFGDEQQADVLRREIAKHLAQVWAARPRQRGAGSASGTAWHNLFAACGQTCGNFRFTGMLQSSWCMLAGGWQGPGL